MLLYRHTNKNMFVLFESRKNFVVLKENIGGISCLKSIKGKVYIMLSFWEVLKKALSYRDAAISAGLMTAGCVAAAVLPRVINNKDVLRFALLGVCFVTFIMIDRFSSYVKAIRMRDLEEHGQRTYKDR